MPKLSKTALKAQQKSVELPGPVPGETVTVNTASLDERRAWLEVTCPKKHALTVQDHAGGSRTSCPTCGLSFDYGGYDHDAAIREATAVNVSDGDTARSADKSR